MEQAMRNEERARALRLLTLTDRKPPAKPKSLQAYFSVASPPKTKRAPLLAQTSA